MSKKKEKFIDRRLIKNKKYHYLYKTTNILDGKYYYGMHSTNDLEDGYLGSGSNLRRAIRKHGKENFKKEILEFFNTRKELVKGEQKLITENILKENNCYNIQMGGEGWNSINTVVVRDENNNCFRVHKDDPRYLNGELTHPTKGKITVKDKNGNYLTIDKNDPRYLNRELYHHLKGTVTTKDKNENFSQVNINDPRYLNGELIHITKNTVVVKDEDDNCFRVHKDDPKYLSGELKFIWEGKKHIEETKQKIGKANSIHQKGENNSQYGTCWIMKDNENKKIKKEDLDNWISKGWERGRKM